MEKRFTEQHVQEWRETGFVVVPEFFTEAEIAPLRDDFDTLYPDRGQAIGAGEALDFKKPGEIGASHPKQFMNFDQLPYQASPAINLISMHPQLIAFAKALLGVEAVHCYQSHTWLKFTGEADYDQAFHCDFGNHTLTVPGDQIAERTVDFIFYLADVTDELGALHYVTKQDCTEVLGPGEVIAPPDKQQALKARERSAAAPSGSLVAHGIDTMHRGTNLTLPQGKRMTMTVGYKARGNEMIGFHVWQFSPQRPWHLVLNHASPEQLDVLGIPLPGDRYWTERTLRLTQQRWPDWDMTVYFEAANGAAPSGGRGDARSFGTAPGD